MANTQAPVYWQFKGPLGAEVRAALAVERTDDDAHHLLLPDERDAYLAGVEMPNSLGCLDDSTVCQSTSHGVLRALGFGARITASANKADGLFQVTLVMTLLDGAQPKTFEGKGATMEEAARLAFVALHGQGTLTLSLIPKDASFRIDGKPYGQGSGDYIIPAGKHTLLVEAPEHRSVEQPIQILAAKRRRIIVELPIAFGKVSLKTDPPTAKAFLDGALWENSQTHRELEPGEHSIRVEAPGFRTFAQKFTVKPSVAHDLTLKLQLKDPPWRTALKDAHPDTKAKSWSIRGGVEGTSARGGKLGLDTSRSRSIESVDESAGLIGFNLSLDWKSDYLMVTALGLSAQTGGGKAKAMLEGNINSELDTLSRTVIRAGWVGGHYSLWRIDAYATFGFGLIFEDIIGKTLTQEYEASQTRFVMGNELGLRYAFDPNWFAGMSAAFDYWPGDRSAATFTLNGGYAFNLPKGWF